MNIQNLYRKFFQTSLDTVSSIYCYSIHLFHYVKRAPRFLGKPHKIKLFVDTIKGYSTIVATRPEPTVLPPSRFGENKIVVFLYTFHSFFDLYYSYFHVVFVILIFFRTILEPHILLYSKVIFLCF